MSTYFNLSILILNTLTFMLLYCINIFIVLSILANHHYFKFLFFFLNHHYFKFFIIYKKNAIIIEKDLRPIRSTKINTKAGN